MTQVLPRRFTRPLTATDVGYIVEVSSDMASWNDGSMYSAAGNVSTNTYTTEASRVDTATNETVTVRDNTAVTAASRRFIRLKITHP